MLFAALVWVTNRGSADAEGIDDVGDSIAVQSDVALGNPQAAAVDSTGTDPRTTSLTDSAVHEGTPADMEPYDPRDWRALNELQLLNNHWDYRDGIVISVDFGFLTKYLQR